MDGTSIAILVAAAVLGIITVVLLWVFASTAGDGRVEVGGGVLFGASDGAGEGADEGAEAGGAEVNVPTRGEPEEFEMLGVLYSSDGDQADTQTNNVVPLWGRQTYRRGHRWNYYVVLDNGVRLPLVLDGQSCDDQLGCDELADNDRIRISELGGSLYRFKKSQEPLIRYIPDVD